MKRRRLEELLRETPIPGAENAERRGERIVRTAFRERTPPRRRVLPRLAVVLASGALLAGLLLTSAGASFRDWLDDTFAPGLPDAERALRDVPGGGRLLVASGDGAWVVQPDGSRRLLGAYSDATWSPHGLFVAAAAGHTLNALEPDGTVRWSRSAKGPVSDPRWSPSGVRIAYRAGTELHVVAGDGSDDMLLDRKAGRAPPVWSPLGQHVLAYVDVAGDLRVADADSGETLGSAPASPRVAALDWAPGGSRLLEVTRRRLRVRELRPDKLSGAVGLGPRRAVALPLGATVRAASFSPDGRSLAVLLQLPARAGRPMRSELYLMNRIGTAQRLLFTAPGRLSDLAWSPDGEHLLIPWEAADQWLFIPADTRGRLRAVGEISEEFSPGAPEAAAFPRVDGWCCER